VAYRRDFTVIHCQDGLKLNGTLST